MAKREAMAHHHHTHGSTLSEITRSHTSNDIFADLDEFIRRPESSTAAEMGSMDLTEIFADLQSTFCRDYVERREGSSFFRSEGAECRSHEQTNGLRFDGLGAKSVETK